MQKQSNNSIKNNDKIEIKLYLLAGFAGLIFLSGLSLILCIVGKPELWDTSFQVAPTLFLQKYSTKCFF